MSGSAINAQLDFYQRSAVTGVIPKRDLEQWLALGLFLYQRVQEVELQWAKEPKTITAEDVQALYRRWHAASEPFLQLIASEEAKGEPVAGAEAFRLASAHAATQASWHLARIAESARQVQERRTRPMAQVMDELRHRIHRQCL